MTWLRALNCLSREGGRKFHPEKCSDNDKTTKSEVEVTDSDDFVETGTLPERPVAVNIL